VAVSGQSAERIFISYRREDAAYPAGWLFDRLLDEYGAGQVFKDVDSIELGDNFAERIQEAVKKCSVFLAVIGPRWLVVTDQHGNRRLDDPDDFVRLEVEEALVRNIPVIPILVDGARMPGRAELPGALQNLTFRHALELNSHRFGSDFARLLEALKALGPPDMRTQPPGITARRTRAATEADGRAAVAAWPTPDSIRSTRDYATVLRRTWVRAGAPSHEEIQRRTGGLVSSDTAKDVLEGHNEYHRWDADDFASALLVLDALGVPDRVVRNWRSAGRRLQRREKGADLRQAFRWGLPVTLPAIVLCLGVGLAIAFMGTPPAAGDGNLAAFAFTCLVFLVAAIAISFLASEEMRPPYDGRFGLIFFICMIASLALGMSADHIGYLDHISYLAQHHLIGRVAMDARNWLIWR